MRLHHPVQFFGGFDHLTEDVSPVSAAQLSDQFCQVCCRCPMIQMFNPFHMPGFWLHATTSEDTKPRYCLLGLWPVRTRTGCLRGMVLNWSWGWSRLQDIRAIRAVSERAGPCLPCVFSMGFLRINMAYLRLGIGTWKMFHEFSGKSITGWWFGCHEFYFPINIGLLIIPIDELIFFRGVGIQPPTSYCYISQILRMFHHY